MLGLEVDRELRDDIQFKLAIAHQRLDQHAQAISALHGYLDAFDPTWTGSVGSATRQRGHLKDRPVVAGRHALEARYSLIDSQLASANYDSARQNVDSLLPILGNQALEFDDNRGGSTVRTKADVAHQRVLTYIQDLPNYIAEVRKFLTAHPDHGKAIELARNLPNSLVQLGRVDEAIAAHRDFVAGKNFKFSGGESATTPDPETGVSPAEQLKNLQRESFFQIAQLFFNQKKYDGAIQQWQAYVTRYPDGAQWAASQSGIVNARFQLALDAVAADDEALPASVSPPSSTDYPLDHRARQILFTLGQMHMAPPKWRPETSRTRAPCATARRWTNGRLISKYPGTEESSLALYRTGIIHSEKLDRLEDGAGGLQAPRLGVVGEARQGPRHPAQREVTGGGHRAHLPHQRGRRGRRHRPATSRSSRSASTRSTSSPTSARPTNSARVDHLDIDLIKPEKTWEVKFDDYEKYREMNHQIPIPENGRKGFAGIVKVEGGDWSATTLVLRSDLDLILKSSRREVLVYAEDRLKGSPAAGADLLVSDGSKIIATGKTGKDGVFRARLEELKSGDSVRVFATGPRAGSPPTCCRSARSTSAPASAPGATSTPTSPPTSPANRSRSAASSATSRMAVTSSPPRPAGRSAITDPAGRLLAGARAVARQVRQPSTADSTCRLGAQHGAYTITASPTRRPRPPGPGTFQVADFKLDRIRLAFDFPQRVYLPRRKGRRHDQCDLLLGLPRRRPTGAIHHPGRTPAQRQDRRRGQAALSRLDTAGYQPGQPLNFSATIPTFNITQSDSRLPRTARIRRHVKPAQPLALSGEPFEVEVQDHRGGRQTGRQGTDTHRPAREAQKSEPHPRGRPVAQPRPAGRRGGHGRGARLTTDPETGKGAITLKLDKGRPLHPAGLRPGPLRPNRHRRQPRSRSPTTRTPTSCASSPTRTPGMSARTSPCACTRASMPGSPCSPSKARRFWPQGHRRCKKGDNPIEMPSSSTAHFPNFRVSVALIDGGRCAPPPSASTSAAS